MQASCFIGSLSVLFWLMKFTLIITRMMPISSKYLIAQWCLVRQKERKLVTNYTGLLTNRPFWFFKIRIQSPPSKHFKPTKFFHAYSLNILFFVTKLACMFPCSMQKVQAFSTRVTTAPCYPLKATRLVGYISALLFRHTRTYIRHVGHLILWQRFYPWKFSWENAGKLISLKSFFFW